MWKPNRAVVGEGVIGVPFQLGWEGRFLHPSLRPSGLGGSRVAPYAGGLATIRVSAGTAIPPGSAATKAATKASMS